MYDFFSGLSADEFAQVMGYDDELSLGTAISMMAGGYAPLWASEILGGGQPDGGFGVNIRWDLLPVFSPVLTQDMILDAIFKELNRRLDTEQETTEPTTAEPTTIATTEPPTTTEPPVTTVAPTTVSPTTTVPTTTVVPTTILPTTVQPTTIAPTTVAPTTTLPITPEPITTTPEPVTTTTVVPTTTPEPITTTPEPMMTTTVAPATTPSPATTEVPTTEPPTTIVDPGEVDADLDGDADLSGDGTTDDLTRDNLISHATSFVQDEQAMKRLLAELQKGTPLDEALGKMLDQLVLKGGGIGIEIIGKDPENILISIPGLPAIVPPGINRIPLKNPDGTWKTPGEVTEGIGDTIKETIGKVSEIPGEIIGKVKDILGSGSPEDVFVIIEDIFKEGTYIGPEGTVYQTPPWFTPDILDDLKGLIGDIFDKWRDGDEETTSLFGVGFPVVSSLDDDDEDDEIKTSDVIIEDDEDDEIKKADTDDDTDDDDDDDERDLNDVEPPPQVSALPPRVDDIPPIVEVVEDDPTTTVTIIIQPEATTPQVTPAPPTGGPEDPPEGGGGGGGGGGMFSGTGTGYMAGLPYQPPGFVPVLYQQAGNPAMNALDKVIQDSLFKGMI